ncbi:hypothetical protein Tco_0155904 [Tanacetum coccineum]
MTKNNFKKIDPGSLLGGKQQFHKFINSKFTLDYDSQMTDMYFVEYTGLEINTSEIHYSNTWVMLRSPFLKEHVIKDIYERRGGIKEQMQTQGESGNDTDADDADISPFMTKSQLA